MARRSQGAIVGADTAKKYGWKIGARVPIQGTIYRRPDGGPWEFTIDGIYDRRSRAPTRPTSSSTTSISTRRSRAQRLRDGRLVHDHDRGPDRAPEIAAKIDAMFANSPSETKTNTEKAFVSDWAKQVGDIGQIMMRDRRHGDVHASSWSPGNTMAQAMRERTNELAVLKTLGFANGRILGLVLAESMFMALIGGGLGLALSYTTSPSRAIRRRAAAGVLLPDTATWSSASAWSRARAWRPVPAGVAGACGCASPTR